MANLIGIGKPDKVLGNNLKVWLDANQVNGAGIPLPSNNSDILVWKNLTGLSDYGKGTGRSNRSPKFISQEDGVNNAVRFTRGTSTTAVDTDMLSILSPISVTGSLSYITVSKRTSNQNIQGIVSNFGNGLNGIYTVNSTYSRNGVANNPFRFSDYLNNKVMVTSVVNATTNTTKIKVGDTAVVSQTGGSNLTYGLS